MTGLSRATGWACRATADLGPKREHRGREALFVALAMLVCFGTAMVPAPPIFAQATNMHATTDWMKLRRLPPSVSGPPAEQRGHVQHQSPEYPQAAGTRFPDPPSSTGENEKAFPIAENAFMAYTPDAITAGVEPSLGNNETVLGPDPSAPIVLHSPANVAENPICDPFGLCVSGESDHCGTDGWYPISRSGGLDWYRFDAQVRGYYLNDQRIEWSGVEATFGAEAAVMARYRRRWDAGELLVLGEFYLNQPFDRNILVDTPERRSYLATFQVETFEISQLLLSWRAGDWELLLGKMPTPFGRYYFPLYTNARLDAPFLRTEAVHWRETGLLLRYRPAWLVCDVALTNGCDDLDTNSSKALVSRIGIEQDCWAGGISIKIQDGIGSEGQKFFNNHLGADLMFRWGVFVLSGEVIYDQYGFRRPGFDPDNITWPRSIYYRESNRGPDEPITGIGYYLNLGFVLDRLTGSFNYGEFYPESIGDPRHDIINRRGIVKLDYSLATGLGAYGVIMLENEGYIAQAGRPRRGLVVLTGIQYTF